MMVVDIVVPTLGESISEATIVRWSKKVGDSIRVDDILVELETDKVNSEVHSPINGVLTDILYNEGDDVQIGTILGHITQTANVPLEDFEAPQTIAQQASFEEFTNKESKANVPLSPAVRKMVEDNALDPSVIPSTGKEGRLIKEDIQKYLEQQAIDSPKSLTSLNVTAPTTHPSTPTHTTPTSPPSSTGSRPRELEERRVRMSRLRQSIAKRLKTSQNTAAILTTFNEVDMTKVMKVRNEYKERFEKRYQIRLGFMSFFIKACIVALKEIPAVNAELEENDLIYKDYYDISVAVGTPQGLVVPVIRDANKLSFAAIESKIAELARRASEGKLSIEELKGGTFTISNGGVYGSLMSTPILNPPQAAILGMHKTMQRPMVIDGKVEARAMMYLALSYDHRIIDGKEAVTFLVRVKECIEDPQRLVLEV